MPGVRLLCVGNVAELIEKRIFIAISLATLWVVIAPEAHACTCEGRTIQLKRKLLGGEATGVTPGWHDGFPGAIFIGRVTGLKKNVKVSASGNLKGMARITFEVERYWKGVTGREAVVYTDPVSNGSCGIPFRKNQKYIVFAVEVEDRLVTGICDFTAEGRYAGVIIKGLALGEGKEPIGQQPLPGRAKPNIGMQRTRTAACLSSSIASARR
jgi:hypothetical protein